MSYNGVLAVDGNPINGSYSVTTGNAMQSLTALSVPITAGSMPAMGVLISVETNSARVGFGGSGSGHVIAAGGSAAFKGQAALNALTLCSGTAGSAATVQITPFF